MRRSTQLLVIFMVCLLIVDDVDAGWRRRLKKWGRRAVKAISTGAAARSAWKALKWVAKRRGKRSVHLDKSKIICDFSSFDLDRDGVVTERETDIFMKITGLQELNEFFGAIDNDEDGKLTMEEYITADVIVETCKTE